MSFSRVAAIGGFIAIVLIILSVGLLSDVPTLDDPVEEVRDAALFSLGSLTGRDLPGDPDEALGLLDSFLD